MKSIPRAALIAVSLSLLVSLSACEAAPPSAEGASTLTSSVTSSQGSSIDAYVYKTGTDGLRVRSAPSTAAAQIGSLVDGQQIVIACQVRGEYVLGSDIWDYVPAAGGYVSDARVYTGYDGFVPGASRCDGVGTDTGESSSGPAARAIAEARSHIGYVEGAGDCNMFSSALGRACEPWCSDFVDYVWMKAGFRVDGITGYSGSIYDYGVKLGTVKSPSSANVEPGDAVLWGAVGGYSAHVGMVTEVYADGSIRVIHGNFADAVHEGTIARSDTIQTGYNIYAFVSPVAKP